MKFWSPLIDIKIDLFRSGGITWAGAAVRHLTFRHFSSLFVTFRLRFLLDAYLAKLLLHIHRNVFY